MYPYGLPAAARFLPGQPSSSDTSNSIEDASTSTPPGHVMPAQHCPLPWDVSMCHLHRGTSPTSHTPDSPQHQPQEQAGPRPAQIPAGLPESYSYWTRCLAPTSSGAASESSEWPVHGYAAAPTSARRSYSGSSSEASSSATPFDLGAPLTASPVPGSDDESWETECTVANVSATAASSRRHKKSARFACAIPGCLSTFTTRVNFDSTSLCEY